MSVILEKIISIVFSLMLVVILIIPLYHHTASIIYTIEKKSQFDEIVTPIENALKKVDVEKNNLSLTVDINLNISISISENQLIFSYTENKSNTHFKRIVTTNATLCIVGYIGIGIYRIDIYYFYNNTIKMIFNKF